MQYEIALTKEHFKELDNVNRKIKNKFLIFFSGYLTFVFLAYSIIILTEVFNNETLIIEKLTLTIAQLAIAILTFIWHKHRLKRLNEKLQNIKKMIDESLKISLFRKVKYNLDDDKLSKENLSFYKRVIDYKKEQIKIKINKEKEQVENEIKKENERKLLAYEVQKSLETLKKPL